MRERGERDFGLRVQCVNENVGRVRMKETPPMAAADFSLCTLRMTLFMFFMNFPRAPAEILIREF